MVSARVRDLVTVDYLCRSCLFKIKVDYECKRNGLTAFARACISNYFDIADILLKPGNADMDYVNKRDGRSVLDLIVQSKNTLAVDYFMNISKKKHGEESLYNKIMKSQERALAKSGYNTPKLEEVYIND
jgi:hypothetical protein